MGRSTRLIFLVTVIFQSAFTNANSYFDINKNTLLHKCDSSWRRPGVIGAPSLGELADELDRTVKSGASEHEIQLPFSKLQYFAQACSFSQFTEETMGYRTNSIYGAIKAMIELEKMRTQARKTFKEECEFNNISVTTECLLATLHLKQVEPIDPQDLYRADWSKIAERARRVESSNRELIRVLSQPAPPYPNGLSGSGYSPPSVTK